MKGTAQQITICGDLVSLGDWVEVEYTTGQRMRGGTIKGTVVELWDVGQPHLLARLDGGWCFHDHDKILSHKTIQPLPAKAR